jgi:hypothetical protein
MKNFSLDIYIFLNIPLKWCFIIQETFVTSEFLHYGFLKKIWVRIKLFEFDKLWEIFDKSSEHYKKCLIFRSKIFFNICFNLSRITLQNGYFKFSSRWPHIFLYPLWKIIWYGFVIFGQKKLEIFWKFSLFLVQKFSNLFFWIHQMKIWRTPPFTLFNYVLVLFLCSCLYSESYFLKWNYGLAEIHRSPLLSRI